METPIARKIWMRQICDMASGLASYDGQYVSKICKHRF